MSVKRYRITADVYDFDTSDDAAREDQVRRELHRLFPLCVVEGYPDIQEIAEDSPFVAADAEHHD